MELLTLSCSLESGSEHPLAKAIIHRAKSESINAIDVSNFSAHPGLGVQANDGHDLCIGGNPGFIQKYLQLPENIKSQMSTLSDEGKTPLLFAKNDDFYGMIAVSDTIREDSVEAIASMKSLGLEVVMVTGDNEKTAHAIASRASIEEIIAGVLPSEKSNVIQKLKSKGRVAMVGDGINDAPALTTADIGFAVAAGTDVAIDAADVVLMKNRLTDVCAAIRLSRATLKNIHQNLFWAFFYNMIGIPLAAGVFIPLTGWTLHPVFCAAAMSLSSFCVVTNALRLNFTNIYDKKGR